MNPLSVGFIGGLPRYLNYNGGLENQIASTVNALRSIDINASWLDREATHQVSDKVDLIHAIGLNPNLAFNLQFLNPNAKLVVSPVSLLPSSGWLAWRANIISRITLSHVSPAWALYHFRRTLQRADGVVCLSKVESRYLQEAFNVPSGKCFVVSNGSHFTSDALRNYPARSSTSSFICIGIIEPRKNQVMIERCAQRLGLAVDYHGRLGTNLDYNRQFIDLVSSSKSYWRGESGREVMLKAHYSNSILLHFGTKEGQPLVILDHLMAGGMVVLLDNRLNRELALTFHGLPIFLSDLSPVSLRRELLKASSFDLTSEAFRIRLTEVADSLTWHHVAKKLVTIYDNILHG